MDWRYLALTSALVPMVPMFLLMIVMPESPQWLTKRGELEKAAKSIQWVLGVLFLFHKLRLQKQNLILYNFYESYSIQFLFHKVHLLKQNLILYNFCNQG